MFQRRPKPWQWDTPHPNVLRFLYFRWIRAEWRKLKADFSESERKHLERRHQHGFFPADEGGLWRHLHTGGNTQRRNNVSTYNVLGWSEAAWKNCGMGVPWRVRRDRIHRRLWDRLWVRRGGRGPLQGGWKLPGGRGEWHNFDMKLWPIKNKSSQ